MYCREIEAALADAPRPGAPTTFSEEQKKQILTIASEKPKKEGVPINRWTHSILAEHVRKKGIVPNISPAHLGRFFKEGQPQASSE
jgi:transposase